MILFFFPSRQLLLHTELIDGFQQYHGLLTSVWIVFSEDRFDTATPVISIKNY